MVKIPATKEGIPAIRQTIAAGINVNVTLDLLVGALRRGDGRLYCGLEDRLAKSEPINMIASVASFFVSRVDTKIDPQLPEGSTLRGRAAIANAKFAYDTFETIFTSPRFATLNAVKRERPASAVGFDRNKNPAYPDTLYVDKPHRSRHRQHGPARRARSLPRSWHCQLTITHGLEEAQLFFADLKPPAFQWKR